MNMETVETIIKLDERVKSATRQFYNSAIAATVHDPVLGHVFGEMELTVTDLLLVGVLSQVHVLVTGPTGFGKTDLVRLVCEGIFGKDGWFLLRLNPHLTEDTFANIDVRKLIDGKGTARDTVLPAPFLSLPCTVLDETNRTPAALTNILLGFCGGRIELKFGLKYDVGYNYKNGYKDSNGENDRYHFVVGTMNEGKEYVGTFELDPALRERLTMQIPFAELRPTPWDIMNIVANRRGHAAAVNNNNAVEQVATVNHDILHIPLQPLGEVYLNYLGNVGRCPHSPTGFHPKQSSQEICSGAQCRIQKISNAFCPSVSGLSPRLLIFLQRTACGLAALRAARTVQDIRTVFDLEQTEQINQLRESLNVNARGRKLRSKIVANYLDTVCVSVADIRAMVPFVGLGGKVWIAEEYIVKHFAGSTFLAMREYERLTYAGLENFFRQHQTLIQQLSAGNGAIEKLKQRLEHAERFNDPCIRHTIEPLLARYCSKCRGSDEIAEELEAAEPAHNCAQQLIQ